MWKKLDLSKEDFKFTEMSTCKIRFSIRIVAISEVIVNSIVLTFSLNILPLRSWGRTIWQ